jgi:hypothetical protein
MLARAGFDQFASADTAVAHARFLRAICKVPPRPLHALISTLVRAETWLRWPLRTLKMLDGVDDTLRRIDPDGARFGLTPALQRRFRRNLLHDGIADLAVVGWDRQAGVPPSRASVEVRRSWKTSESGRRAGRFRLVCTRASHWHWALGTTSE